MTSKKASNSQPTASRTQPIPHNGQDLTERATLLALKFTSQSLDQNELARRVTTLLDYPQNVLNKQGGATHQSAPTSEQLAIKTLPQQHYLHGGSKLYLADCFDWIHEQPDQSMHAVVTDPPYGLQEYSPKEQAKLRAGRGGSWRLPPAYDGHQRSPVPRFTVLDAEQLKTLGDFFFTWTRYLRPKLRPGAHVIVASNPLLSHIVGGAVTRAGLEKRGEIIRLVMTMRGGDRPKGAEQEFSDVTVMPRSMWEPWLVFREPLEGTVHNNLRKWQTGGLRRPSNEAPFGDVIRSAPTRKKERAIADHPSLKPQAFLRQVVRAVLPLGEGTVTDLFAGAGSTLAAAEAVGYPSTGVEIDQQYFEIAKRAIAPLSRLQVQLNE